MLKKVRKNDKGFTLVELIVVIAIMAVLAALLIPRIMGNVEESRRQRDITTAQTIASEITIWNAKALTDDSDSITPVPATLVDGHVLQADELPTDLPDGTEFPSTTYVSVIVDASGNASILVVTPTP